MPAPASLPLPNPEHVHAHHVTATGDRHFMVVSHPKRAGFKDVPDFRKWLDTMKEGSLFQRIEVAFED